MLKNLQWFTSFNGLDIKSLGIKTVKQFYNAGWLRRYSDLFHLDDYRKEIICEYGLNFYEQMQNEIEECSKNTRVKQFLRSVEYDNNDYCRVTIMLIEYFEDCDNPWNEFIKYANAGFYKDRIDGIDWTEANNALRKWWGKYKTDIILCAKHFEFANKNV